MAPRTTKKSSTLLPLEIRQALHWRASQHLTDFDVSLIIGAVADHLERHRQSQFPDFSTDTAIILHLRMQAKAAVK
jgi:hypothetical protein